LAYAGTEQHGEYIKMNFEELRDRKLKVITTQMIRSENGTGNLQSATFNSATKAIIIRGWSQTNQAWFTIKFGTNPIASYQDIPMIPMNNNSGASGDIFTFNVNPGDKVAGVFLNQGSIECRLYITELGY
jgi:hypothetical protein